MCGVSLSLPVRALFAAHLHQGGYVRAAQAIATRLFDLYEIKRKRKSGGVRESVGGRVVDVTEVNNNTANSNTDNDEDDVSSNDDNDKYNSVILLKPPDFLLTAWVSALKLRSASRLILQTVQAAQAVRYAEECNQKEAQKIKETEKERLKEKETGNLLLTELNDNKSESEIKSENDPQNPPSADGVNQKIDSSHPYIQLDAPNY